MSCDYNKIREGNIKEYGEGTRHLAFLGNLYTDKTHFIFELLQNAEDAGATQICFDLYHDCLKVFHDGREFNEEDVRGVCGVGEGTKTEDLTKIGKFGIGFKSVYSYTQTPEIHSGDENFHIKSFVRPFQTEPIDFFDDNKWTTLFVFPFDRPEIKKRIAFDSLGKRLKNLDSGTLLFLKKIREISWIIETQTDNGGRGFIGREEPKVADNASMVKVYKSFNGEERLFENWLLFSRSVRLPNSLQNTTVEIAFKWINSEIVPVRNEPLIVFFPTEKETRLGFLVHGPYQTTPARDNIPKDEPWNKTLISETCILVRDALLRLRSEKCINIKTLQTLPIRPQDFPQDSMFRPIYDSIKRLFFEEPLLPTSDNDFVKDRFAKLADSSPLRQLLNDEQLNSLMGYNSKLRWLDDGISENKTPDLWKYLRYELEIEELRPEKIISLISNEFYRAQSNGWIVRFYKFIAERKALYRKGELHKLKNFVRLSTGRHVTPLNIDGAPNVYLGDLQGTNIPTVEREILQDETCLKFLRDVGLSEPDIADEVIESILPKYRNNQTTDTFSETEHLNDVKKILQACKGSDRRKEIEKAVKTTRFIKTLGENKFKRPEKVYWDCANLREYFDGTGVNDVYFLDNSYKKIGPQQDDWQRIGVQIYPRREKSGKLTEIERKGLRGGEKATTEDPAVNYRLHGLSPYLSAIVHSNKELEKKAKALLLWNLLIDIIAIQGSKYFYSTYWWFYRTNKNATFQVSFLKELLSTPWVPTKYGSFCRPPEANVAQLEPEFKRERQLTDLLEFGREAKLHSEQYRQQQTAASQLGVKLEDIEFINSYSESFHQWKERCRKYRDGIELPEQEISNPVRRAQKVAERSLESPAKTTEIKERSVRVSGVDPEPWLRSQYTNEDDQLVCQICLNEMPFRKRNGDYYFVRVQISDDFDFVDEKLYLALCPVCAEKYKEFVKRSETVQKKVVEDIEISDNNTIAIELDSGSKDSSIRFTGKHIGDLHTIFQTRSRSLNQGEVIEKQQEKNYDSERALDKHTKKINEDPGRQLVHCPHCHVKVRKDRLAKHIKKIHSTRKKVSSFDVSKSSTARPSTIAQKRCPGCGAINGCYCR